MIILVLSVCTLMVSAQKTIDGIRFMTAYGQLSDTLISRFGVPVTETREKLVFADVVFDGERYSEANFFFDEKGRMHLLRLKKTCVDKSTAVASMNSLWEKYGGEYQTTEDETPEDGKFVVGFDTGGARLFTISTFRNRCDMTFGPFLR